MNIFGEELHSVVGELFKLPELTIGDKSSEQIIKALDSMGIERDFWCDRMINTDGLISSERQTLNNIVKIRAGDIDSDNLTIKEVFKNARELGFELLPKEVGPQIWLNTYYWGSILKDGLIIGMNPIVASTNHHEFVFRLKQYESGNRCLRSCVSDCPQDYLYWDTIDDELVNVWDANSWFAFRLPSTK